jgi:hypothetical protein
MPAGSRGALEDTAVRSAARPPRATCQPQLFCVLAQPAVATTATAVVAPAAAGE